MPIIHRARFYLSLDRAPNARPPICLLYAMWTLAASLSPKYSAYEEVFYERTRRYLELAEMKVRQLYLVMIRYFSLTKLGAW